MKKLTKNQKLNRRPGARLAAWGEIGGLGPRLPAWGEIGSLGLDRRPGARSLRSCYLGEKKKKKRKIKPRISFQTKNKLLNQAFKN